MSSRCEKQQSQQKTQTGGPQHKHTQMPGNGHLKQAMPYRPQAHADQENKPNDSAGGCWIIPEFLGWPFL